ncbi:TPA: hypothetical protein DD449_03985 [Candidatus Berkelbacteria bacterium]|nr:hypothetical protein [Candidatus Berkelbacteria bacterium]
MNEIKNFSPFTKGGDTEGVQQALNTIALWEAARSLKKARVVQRNIIEENRTDFFTGEQNELIDNYTARKQEALSTVLKTFKNLKG